MCFAFYRTASGILVIIVALILSLEQERTATTDWPDALIRLLHHEQAEWRLLAHAVDHQSLFSVEKLFGGLGGMSEDREK